MSQYSAQRRFHLAETDSRVLLAPDDTPVLGSDDYRQYFAWFQWMAATSGTYLVWVTSFESVNTGDLVISRR